MTVRPAPAPMCRTGNTTSAPRCRPTGPGVAAWGCLLAVTLGVPALAQPKFDAAAELKKARAAIAAKDTAAAVQAADAVLRADPKAREAYLVKIEAYTAGDERPAALKVYADAVRALGRQDARLLQPLSRAELRALAGSKTASLSAAALGHLARAGDTASRTALEKAAGPKGEDAVRLTAEDALAELGDPTALRAVEARLRSDAAARRAGALSLLASAAPARARAALTTLLADPDLNVRLAAVAAADRLNATETVPALRAMLASADTPLVRISAGAVLVRLGEASARPLMLEALTSPVEDARLAAADAFARAPKALAADWVPAVRGLLESRDVLTRLQAARQIAAVDQPAAKKVIHSALAEPNPAVRDAAASALLALPSPDVELLWPLLADESPWIRVKAAGALLRAAQPAR